MAKLVLSVFVGGALGAVLRFAFGFFIDKHFQSSFPLATFLVNVFGSFLIGLFYAVASVEHGMAPAWRLFLMTGFCGGFTTFSTFALENIKLLQQGNYLVFALYAFASFTMCLLAVVAGMYSVKALQ